MAHRIQSLLGFVLVTLIPHLGCRSQVAQPPQMETRIIATSPSPVVAITSGYPVRQEEMWSQLLEASGSEIFQDISLSYAIEDALTRAGMDQISQVDVEYEKKLLNRTLSNNNMRYFENILADRGLGKNRLDALCKRTAGLRKLVQPNVVVTDASIDRMFALIHGPKYPTKIIVTPTLEQASNAITRIKEGESFSEVAATMSIDQSAMRGGIVDPISPADPLWPTAIRELIQNNPIGECSSPILIKDRWIIITVVDQPTATTVKREEVRQEIHQLSKLTLERLEMDKLTLALKAKIGFTLIDPLLKRAVQSR